MTRLQGKIAIITGGSSGIGKAAVDLFVANGASVVAVDLTEPSAPEEPYPKGVEFVKGSVVLPETWTRAFEAAKKVFGANPNVLVNNAGVAHHAPLVEVSGEDWERVYDVNLRAPLHGMQVFIRTLLAEERKGSIVNISSIAGINGFPYCAAYGSSKAALANLTKVAAAEYGAKGIRVNAIAPGSTNTALTRNLPPAEHAGMQQMIAVTPLGRIGEPVDVANAIVYLSSDEADYMTGHVLVLDGGFTVL
ncbi:hypothetical protein Q8F55_008531 [Vanrija albida]|uniref:Uncharacterized protein n=1 Tax=Vanrija albida TaxID=181172 RepID=A0ABR3PR36_9TREE